MAAAVAAVGAILVGSGLAVDHLSGPGAFPAAPSPPPATVAAGPGPVGGTGPGPVRGAEAAATPPPRPASGTPGQPGDPAGPDPAPADPAPADPAPADPAPADPALVDPAPVGSAPGGSTPTQPGQTGPAGPTASVPAPGTPVRLSVEAEDAWLGPDVEVLPVATASGGQVVALPGGCDCHAVTFAGVTVPWSGEYRLVLHHVRLPAEGAAARRVEMVVNGADAMVLNLPAPPTGGVLLAGVPVRLVAGENTIQVWTARHRPAPNLDRITVAG